MNGPPEVGLPDDQLLYLLLFRFYGTEELVGFQGNFPGEPDGFTGKILRFDHHGRAFLLQVASVRFVR